MKLLHRLKYIYVDTAYKVQWLIRLNCLEWSGHIQLHLKKSQLLDHFGYMTKNVHVEIFSKIVK